MENKVIFESEEEARKMLHVLWLDYTPESEICALKRLKQAGYIRKSPVEEAEEFLNKNVQVWSFENRELVARGFWELKSEIERLKK